MGIMSLFYILTFAALIILEFTLSKLNHRWPSMILPILSFTFSFLLCWLLYLDLSSDSTIVDVVPTWFIMNIPTVVFTIISVKVRRNPVT